MRPFGNYLSTRRQEKGLTAEGVIRRMKKVGVQLDQSTLYNYEAGTVSAPDAGVLWALSKIYAVSHEEMIALLVSVRAGNHDPSLPSGVSTNPEYDEVEEKLILAFRAARVEAKREILDLVDYVIHKGGGAKRGEKKRRVDPESNHEAALKKRGRSGSSE
jgi:transcriptional regulator with XRE-family HTH domain